MTPRTPPLYRTSVSSSSVSWTWFLPFCCSTTNVLSGNSRLRVLWLNERGVKRPNKPSGVSLPTCRGFHLPGVNEAASHSSTRRRGLSSHGLVLRCAHGRRGCSNSTRSPCVKQHRGGFRKWTNNHRLRALEPYPCVWLPSAVAK